MRIYRKANIFNEQMKKRRKNIFLLFFCLSEEFEASRITTSSVWCHTCITITHIKFSLDS